MLDLTKWPRLLVVGESVTPEQADEILIRTMPYNLHCNNQSWCAEAHRIVGFLDEGTLDYNLPRDDRLSKLRKMWEHNDLRRGELGIIPLDYLANARIMSTWIGGVYGWCDWDGSIGCSNYNVGKWPSVNDLTQEWAQIADAFPYLDLTAQVITDEGEGEVAAEWAIRSGEVSLRSPGEAICSVNSLSTEDVLRRLNSLHDAEVGVSADRLEQAVQRVLSGRQA